ncbi:MAG: VOC family protein [Candidatus Dormiibacterota bacterium]
MTSRVTDVIVDSRDPLRLARWWTEVLDYHIVGEASEGWVAIAPWESNEDRPDDDAFRRAAQVPRLVFVPVPESKTIKNRIHLDIWSIDRSQDEEVARLLERGAVRVDIGQGKVPWIVLADPEGNEFCVLD